MGGHKIVRVDKRMLEAAVLAADGKSVAEIAKHFSVNETTVRAWLRNEEVQAEIIACVRQQLVPMVAKAARVINKQMDSTKANGFLAQNAANTTLSRYGAPLLEEKDNEVKISFVNGLIPLGMPEDTSAEAEELSD